ncbi:hypothetical protein SRRS_17940 [Sporomusa rhizae]|uniref:hypothetical protein n=1 Tax=Sporomusa rhizae TaxID=357999 RepID=UPI00352BCCFD
MSSNDMCEVAGKSRASQFVPNTEIEREINTAISKTVTEAINRATVPLIEKLEKQVKEIHDLKTINTELLERVNDINNKTSYVRSKRISYVVFGAIIAKLLLVGFFIMNGKIAKLFKYFG